MLAEYQAQKKADMEAARQALEQGCDLLRGEGLEPRLPADMKAVIWRLMQDAAETIDRLPDRELGWLRSHERAAWPEVVRSWQERFEVEAQQLQDGMQTDDKSLMELKKSFVITDARAINRMLTVLSWFKFMRARTPSRHRRDINIVLAMAAGRSQKQIRRLTGGAGHSAAHMVKQKALGQIAKQFELHLFSK